MNKKGFTLIEMLVVIAIIAVLVSVIIPTVTSATTRAEAAADAANLRSVLGFMNSELGTGVKIDDAVAKAMHPESKLNPGAQLQVLYTDPGFIKVYYVKGTEYYGLAYLADVAENGSSDKPITKPATAGTWYQAGAVTE